MPSPVCKKWRRRRCRPASPRRLTFGLRDYGCAGQFGLEKTVEAYVARLVEVFREVRRVLQDDGTLWLNLGDSYASSGKAGHQHLDAFGKRHGSGGGHKASSHPAGRAATPPGLKTKNLLGIPWRVAFALQADGWILRSDIIWAKPNPMPESVRDRPTRSHEYLFLLAKRPCYYYDADAAKERAIGKNEHDLTGPGYSAPGQSPNKGNRKPLHGPTYARHRSSVPGGQDLRNEPSGFRNRRSVWTVATQPYKGAHFAAFPPKLIEPCVLAGCPAGGLILDPFVGSGTTGLVALQHGRRFVGIDLCLRQAQERLAPLLTEVQAATA